jgi:type II secretory pathway predicted ATPase ExeA
MYESHFGLRQRPFRPAPEGAAWYPATSHELALDRLTRALANDDGLMLVTGEPGTGKTCLCHRLAERLGDSVTTAFLTHGHCPDRAALLQAILFDLGQPYAGRSEQELRLGLTELLLQNFAAGRKTVLLLDEAQSLPAECLEELRLLSNLESRHGKAFQAVLSAQPGLQETLRRPDLSALRQRLRTCVQIEPLDINEAADFLLHQIRSAGGQPETLVDDEAIALLARSTGGVPRVLNQAAHLAFELACAGGAESVDVEAVGEALTQLGLEILDDEPRLSGAA